MLTWLLCTCSSRELARCHRIFFQGNRLAILIAGRIMERRNMQHLPSLSRLRHDYREMQVLTSLIESDTSSSEQSSIASDETDPDPTLTSQSSNEQSPPEAQDQSTPMRQIQDTMSFSFSSSQSSFNDNRLEYLSSTVDTSGECNTTVSIDRPVNPLATVLKRSYTGHTDTVQNCSGGQCVERSDFDGQTDNGSRNTSDGNFLLITQEPERAFPLQYLTENPSSYEQMYHVIEDQPLSFREPNETLPMTIHDNEGMITFEHKESNH
ncbi:hypothetical protein QAD02_016894 [Eretmocerus hayati]|uniref:Uncharacterized protein n=3 Tax=Eretmocerus hayati TaxID=131215 RepID=A0ACC2PCE6_9HYME|nr:hypothetical protein QAD02_012758 [Eretmocerus hayati]KAJ8679003.1 hypothetical protein QAD02_014790 [Eretmocerus hayati]KAJ8681107.1 hypothetical protein QAD02_016894 [Eretmocerus hayati]